MENFEQEYQKKCKCKEGCLKYGLMFLATLLGSFLAFYFIADYTFKTMFNPEYQMRRAEKLMRDIDRQIAREMNKNIKDINKDYKEIDVIAKSGMKNPVNITENEKSYIITIGLKPFGGNAKNIKVSVEENNVLKIEGSNEIKKGDRENMINMIQSYKLQHKVSADKMTTNEDKGNYVITLPFEKE